MAGKTRDAIIDFMQACCFLLKHGIDAKLWQILRPSVVDLPLPEETYFQIPTAAPSKSYCSERGGESIKHAGTLSRDVIHGVS